VRIEYVIWRLPACHIVYVHALLTTNCYATARRFEFCGDGTFGPLSMNFTATSSPVPVCLISLVTPKLPCPSSPTCARGRA